MEIRELILSTKETELEKTVLGTILVSKDSHTLAIEYLNEDCFLEPSHKAIYRAVKTLWEEKEPVDIVTVTMKCKSQKTLGTIVYNSEVSELTNKVGSNVNFETHLKILKQRQMTRQHIDIAREILNTIPSESYDPFEMNDMLSKMIADCMNLISVSDVRTIQEIGSDVTKRITLSSEKDVTGISSGHQNVDKITGGFHDPDMFVLAGRPGMGKTALALSWTSNICMNDIPVGFVSGEMSDEQLVMRLISIHSGIDSNTLRNGRLSEKQWQAYHKALGLVESFPLSIIDTKDFYGAINYLKRLHREGKLKIGVIDYIQLMSIKGFNGSREQEVSKMSQEIKGLAKELKIPIIALAQLSRAVETRGGDKMPQLSDLRESGAIEQDADIVSFIYRPEYYKITQTADGISTQGLGLLRLAKHRNGSLEDIMLKFVSYLTKFEDYSLEPIKPQIKNDEPF